MKYPPHRNISSLSLLVFLDEDAKLPLDPVRIMFFEVFHVLDHPEQARVALRRPLYEMCVVALVGELASNMLMVAGWGLPSSAQWPCPVPTRILRVGWFAFPACLSVYCKLRLVDNDIGVEVCKQATATATSLPKFFISL